MRRQIVEKIFAKFAELNPEPKGELYFTNTFTLLIAVVLSAQATDKGVNKATKSLFERIKVPQDILDMGEDDLREAVKSIGLYKTKAANIFKLCMMLVEKFDSKVPKGQKDLESLAGVGRKTANVVRNIAFGEHTIAVDTHVFRVSNRTGIAKGKNVVEVEEKLEIMVPKMYKKHAHHWLILHGRYICTAKKLKSTNQIKI